MRGLGLSAVHSNIELNLIVDSDRDRADLKAWFDNLWSDQELVEDVKDDVLQYLAQRYQNHSPTFIYYKTLFHIFAKFLGEAGKTDSDLGRTTLFDTEIWKALFDFQKDGVKGAINKILVHNGCILADSVGLGKTFSALAVIKYFELKNKRVLVLCPKKLRENWTVYKLNDQLNPFVNDRFRYDVLSHTDLSRDTGYTGDINLGTITWATTTWSSSTNPTTSETTRPAAGSTPDTSSVAAGTSGSCRTSSSPASKRKSCSFPPRR